MNDVQIGMMVKQRIDEGHRLMRVINVNAQGVIVEAVDEPHTRDKIVPGQFSVLVGLEEYNPLREADQKSIARMKKMMKIEQARAPGNPFRD